MENEDAWGQLVCTTDLDSPPLMISKEKFTIGRTKACDVCLSDNKLVSSTHCFIQRNDEGEVWLYDSSTNGTLLNLMTKISKGNGHLLAHGDEFFIVYKKDNEKLNIGYVYQDMKELAKEGESENDETLEYDTGLADATLLDEDINMVPSPPSGVKRTQAHASKDGQPPCKRSKAETSTPLDVSSDPTPADTANEKTGKESSCAENKSEKSTSKVDNSQTTNVDKKEEKKEDVKIGHTAEPKEDALLETLLCIICQEILHDCISLQPCMHSFCSGCYSDWMHRSKECPSCRLNVDRINKNHIVNNLVEAYLKEHPDKKRPEEDIKDLDSKNKITRDMLYPAGLKKGSSSSLSGSSDEYNDTDEEEIGEEDDYDPQYPNPVNAGFRFPPFVFNANPIPRPPRTICRQCPGYVEPATLLVKGGAGAMIGLGCGNAGTAGPSTDTGDGSNKTIPTPPVFVCGPNQNHYLCHCCIQSMPDRRHERAHNADIPPQQCSICMVGHCHMYWGCKNINCDGCLAKFKDMNFTNKVFVSLVLDNFHESAILKNYLEDKNISVRDLLLTCIQKKEANEYVGRATPVEQNINSNTVVCYTCGLRNFKELVYQYRREIPNDDLPEEVTKRSDCYWGKNCRTQKNKPVHAINFNHICEQTRTT